jgi:hypothetical protein
MQEEESRLDTTNQDLDTPAADMEGTDSEIDPGAQREEVRPMDSEYGEGDMNAPVDDTPELEEEVVE